MITHQPQGLMCHTIMIIYSGRKVKLVLHDNSSATRATVSYHNDNLLRQEGEASFT